MHTVEQLDQLIRLARELGYTVRQEWLGGDGGGTCELRGKKHIFIDLANSAAEQLDNVASVLAGDTRLAQVAVAAELRDMLKLPKAA
jgi:hypothetical protein